MNDKEKNDKLAEWLLELKNIKSDIQGLVKELDKIKEAAVTPEANALQKEMVSFISSLNDAQAASVQPDPSRLEIAAKFYTAEWCDTPETALEHADKLIAAHLRTREYGNT